MPYRWSDDYGERFGVMRRDAHWVGAVVRYRTRVMSSTRTRSPRNSLELQAVRYPELWRKPRGFETDGVPVELDHRRSPARSPNASGTDRVWRSPVIDDRLAHPPVLRGSVGTAVLVRSDWTTGGRCGNTPRPRGIAGRARRGVFCSSLLFVPSVWAADESAAGISASLRPGARWQRLVIIDASDFAAQQLQK